MGEPINLEEKTEKLLSLLRSYGSVLIGLSGGVDSALLSRAAFLALGERALAITASSPLLSSEEREDAKRAAAAAGIRHLFVDTNDLAVPDIVKNDKLRCYYCKKHRFSQLVEYARAHGFKYIADGSNVSDVGDYRPGERALKELKIVSPLALSGFSKADIRALSRLWHLPLAEKPSAACLASRVAYNLPLTEERLSRIDEGEAILHEILGAGQLRLRDHGEIARIELGAELMEKFWPRREELAARLGALGFPYVTLDLKGYRMGSQNEVL